MLTMSTIGVTSDGHTVEICDIRMILRGHLLRGWGGGERGGGWGGGGGGGGGEAKEGKDGGGGGKMSLCGVESVSF